ncbi:MAG: serine hydrolase [Gemmatimonadota bacterium]
MTLHAMRLEEIMLAGALLASMAAMAQPAVAQEASDSTLRALIAERVDAGRSVGIVAGVMDPAGPRVLSYGHAALGGGDRPLDGNTVFEIGSVTKTFTAVLLAEMVGRGEVALDDPVARYLPSEVRVPARNGRAITLLDLATQSSGLPRLPSNMTPKDPANPYADYTEAQLYAFLNEYQLIRDPGAEYEYSNLGVGLLGLALARRADMSYEQLLTERVLRPLGMNDTRITLTDDMRRRFATGHADGSAVENWDLPVLAGAGAIRSTANDLLKFVAANLASTGPLHAAMVAAQTARRPIPGDQQIGLAWHISEHAGTRIIWHNGGTGGYHTFVGFVPAAHRGVVILANSADDIDRVGVHQLDSTVAPEPVRRAVALAPTVLQRYVGRYQLAPAFSIEVTREGDALFGQGTGQGRFRLYSASEKEFFLIAVPAEVSFTVDSAGGVIGMVLHQNGRDSPGRKVP